MKPETATQMTTMAQLRQADWAQLEKDVVLRIRLLAEIARGLSQPPHDRTVADKLANELILPNLRFLAAFCEAIDVERDQP